MMTVTSQLELLAADICVDLTTFVQNVGACNIVHSLTVHLVACVAISLAVS